MRRIYILCLVFLVVAGLAFFGTATYGQDDDATRNVIKQGLLGAGTGAIASGASGGNAGTGALIGAGTGIIGGALLDAATAPPASSRRVVRRAAPPPPDDDEYYYEDEPDEYYVEEAPPQESSTGKVIKQGLLGAGTGAIAAGASGGDAGKGALIGAGTGVIGGVLLDAITQPPAQRRVYRRAPPARTRTTAQNPRVQTVQQQDASTDTSRKKIVRKYDESGKVISEEEIYY